MLTETQIREALAAYTLTPPPGSLDRIEARAAKLRRRRRAVTLSASAAALAAAGLVANVLLVNPATPIGQAGDGSGCYTYKVSAEAVHDILYLPSHLPDGAKVYTIFARKDVGDCRPFPAVAHWERPNATNTGAAAAVRVLGPHAIVIDPTAAPPPGDLPTKVVLEAGRQFAIAANQAPFPTYVSWSGPKNTTWLVQADGLSTDEALRVAVAYARGGADSASAVLGADFARQPVPAPRLGGQLWLDALFGDPAAGKSTAGLLVEAYADDGPSFPAATVTLHFADGRTAKASYDPTPHKGPATLVWQLDGHQFQLSADLPLKELIATAESTHQVPPEQVAGLVN